jgi:hypothetical protein
MVSRTDFKIVWNLIYSFLMWFIWREMNAQSFDDCEKTSSYLQLCLLKSLFEWISANAFLNISNSVNFCALFSLFMICWVFLLYTSYILQLPPLCFLLNLLYLYFFKKKNIYHKET